MSSVLRSVRKRNERSDTFNGRGRRHRPRGVRGSWRSRCQGGIDPVLDSAWGPAGTSRNCSTRKLTALAGERYDYRKDGVSQAGIRHADERSSRDGRVGRPATCRFACPGFAMSRSARFSLRSYEALRWQICAVNDLLTSQATCEIMGSRAATTRRPPRRFPAAIAACRTSRPGVPRVHSRPARRNSANSRSGTSPGWTLWPSSLTRQDCSPIGDDGRRVWASTHDGEDKRFLGFVETDTVQNEQVLTPFLRSLVERGRRTVSQGLLVIVDGGKGLRAAVRKALPPAARAGATVSMAQASRTWCTLPGQA